MMSTFESICFILAPFVLGFVALVICAVVGAIARAD